MPSDLLPCGAEPLRLLVSSLDLLASGPYTERNFTSGVLDCEKIIAHCDAAFRSGPWKDVPRYWRRLYADAAILKAVSKIGTVQLAQTASKESYTSSASSSKRKVEYVQQEADPEGHDEALLECIRSLDLAIVVAGAPGPGRKQMILDLIEVGQSCLSDRYRLQDQKAKKARQSSDGTIPVSLSTETLQLPQVRATLPIPEPTSAPTFDSFILKDHQSPFVLRGFAKDWPACEQLPGDQGTRWASGQYLLEIAGGRGRVVPCEVGGKYSDEDWGQQILPWQDFLARSGWQVDTSKPADDETSSQTLYLAQHTLFDQFPKLEADILPPDYVFASAEIPGYTPPVRTVEGDEEEGEQRRVIEDVVKSVWIGPEGTVSPAHTDPHFNCYSESGSPA
jgi:lysine-specific demethylase 8